MKKIHVVYADDDKEFISSLRLVIDNLNFDLEKTKPYVFDLSDERHNIIIQGMKYKNVDIIGLNQDGMQAKYDTELVTWYNESLVFSEDEEYYVIKTPLFLNFKCKFKKVTREKFNKYCK